MVRALATLLLVAAPALAAPATFKDTPAFRQKFAAVKPGMTEPQVRAALGDPVRIVQDQWLYFEDRAPRAGEQLTIFQITFAKGVVTDKRLVPGPDATGPPN